MLSRIFYVVLAFTFCLGVATQEIVDEDGWTWTKEGMKIKNYVDMYKKDPTNVVVAREVLTSLDTETLERLFAAPDNSHFNRMLNVDDSKVQYLASAYLNKTAGRSLCAAYTTCFKLSNIFIAGTLITYGASYDDTNCFDKCNGYSTVWRRQVSSGTCSCISAPWASPVAVPDSDWHGGFYATTNDGSRCIADLPGFQFWATATYYTSNAASWGVCEAWCISHSTMFGPPPVDVYATATGQCWCVATSNSWWSPSITIVSGVRSAVMWLLANC